jgi:hypothetical protein
MLVFAQSTGQDVEWALNIRVRVKGKVIGGLS